jgi:hypothetical protein
LEKLALVWQRAKPYFLGFLLVLGVAAAIWALIYIPKMEVPVCPPGKEGLPPKICFDIENEARRTLAYIMGGVLAIIGITLAYRRIRALERQVLVAQEGQITERFTRAIEHLGSDKMEIRLGGIYGLERIANDSDKDYWTIMETLTAFVRERAPWREQTQNDKGQAIEAEPADQEILTLEEATEAGTAPEKTTTPPASAPAPKVPPKPATDIQAVLTVLGRRKYRYGQKEEKGRLDMRHTDLRAADLGKAHMEGADLMGAHLVRAILSQAHVEGAIFIEAHLERAEIMVAHLERAYLSGAHLEGAKLTGANLEGAYLYEAHLEGAHLYEAHLEGADLRGATGLTREQLADAIINNKTILPDYLQEERPQDKGAEEEQEK